MPYKKGGKAEYLARQRKNYVRKAETREKWAEKFKDNPALSEMYKQQAQELRAQAKRFYATFRNAEGKRVRKMDTEINQLMAEAQALRVDRLPTERQMRKNEQIRLELNNPRPSQERIDKAIKEGNPLKAAELMSTNPNAKYSQEEVQTVYKATQELWQGKSGDRNYLIIKGLRDRGLLDSWSLEEAVDVVLKMVAEDRARNSASGGMEIEDEYSNALNGPDTKDPSPRHLQTVRFIDEMMDAIATYAPTETEE